MPRVESLSYSGGHGRREKFGCDEDECAHFNFGEVRAYTIIRARGNSQPMSMLACLGKLQTNDDCNSVSLYEIHMTHWP
jgi:hypothetical protein